METKCSGSWCKACSNEGCCKEQEYWDKIIEDDEKELKDVTTPIR